MRGDTEAHGGSLTRNSCSWKKQRARQSDSAEENRKKTAQRAILGQKPAPTARASSKPTVSKRRRTAGRGLCSRARSQEVAAQSPAQPPSIASPARHIKRFSEASQALICLENATYGQIQKGTNVRGSAVFLRAAAALPEQRGSPRGAERSAPSCSPGRLSSALRLSRDGEGPNTAILGTNSAFLVVIFPLQCF